VLQQEIRKGSTKKRAGQAEWVEDLVLTELVGKGGFGVVYKGSYRGAVAAVKVRRCGSCHTALE
jgi:predicted Ser/Thr protein kinase